MKNKTKFFHFRQNNSGGRFHFDKKTGITINVIIEAKDYIEANDRAENIGLYFNGCEDDIDCSCCGDRWIKMYNNKESKSFPHLYGKKITDMHTEFKRRGIEKNIAIHYLDGKIEWF